MQKKFINTEGLNSVAECLEQLQLAEASQYDIQQQLDLRENDLAWRKKAEIALRTVKAKRRLITARLAVLRQEEKERNLRLHQQHNDYLVDELKRIVTPSSFAHCVRRALEKEKMGAKR